MQRRGTGRLVSLWAGVPLVVVLLMTVPAQAHTGLVSSAPEDGDRLVAAPTHVVLEFARPVSASDASVRVQDGRGAQLAEAVLLSYTGRVASVVLAPGGAAGRWQVRYEVRGEDGHLVAGALGFGVDAEAARSNAVLPALPATGIAALALAAALLRLRAWARRSPDPAA